MEAGSLAGLLAHLGLDDGPGAMLDLLWLAPLLTAGQQDAATAHTLEPGGSGSPRPDRAGPHGEGLAPDWTETTAQDTEVGFYLPGRAGRAAGAQGMRAAGVGAPQVQVLTERTSLERSLRWLKRYEQSADDLQIDEVASAEMVAETGIWLPAMRPRPRRWMDLALVVDSHESMDLWRPAVPELQDLLEDLGAFADIRLWSLDWTGLRGKGPAVRGTAGSLVRSPRELLRPSGDRMILIFSDCTDPNWQSREARRTLTAWAQAGPLAIVQPLPPRLWDLTSVGPVQIRFLPTVAGVPNSDLRYEQLYEWEAYDEEPRNGDNPSPRRSRPPVAVPIVELNPGAMASWARLVTGAGSEPVSGSAMLLVPGQAEAVPDVSADPPDYSPEDLIKRFQLIASPAAIRLARCLAAAPVSIAVMRLIQRAVLREADHAAIAEVFLGGLLCKVAGPSGDDRPYYDFRPGRRGEPDVRTLLLDQLEGSQALDVLLAVADEITSNVSRRRQFRALIAGDDVAGDLLLEPDSRPFALVAASVLHRLGGQFASAAERIWETDEQLSPPGWIGGGTEPPAEHPRIGPDGDAETESGAATPSALTEPKEMASAGLPGAGIGEPEVAGELADASALADAADVAEIEQLLEAIPASADNEPAGRDAPSAAPDYSLRAFSDALRGLELPPPRSADRPLLCPYCYHSFASRDVLFRCSGATEDGMPECPSRIDPVLESEMGIRVPVRPAFRSSSRAESARCPDCHGQTFDQICPHCHSSLPGEFRTATSRLVGLIGSAATGKTSLMTVLVHELRQSIGRALSSATQAADSTTGDRFRSEYEQPLYLRKELLEPTSPGERYVRPLVFRVTLPGRPRLAGSPRHQQLLLSFADGAGEDLINPAKVALMARYLAAADVVIFTVDPLQFDAIRHRVPPDVALPDPQDPVASLERVTRMLTAIAKTEMIEKPTAVLLTKLDAIWDQLPPDSVLRRVPATPDQFDEDDSAELHDEVTTFLTENGGAEIVRTLTTRYRNWRFFAVSALGSPPTAANELSSEIRPRRIADPLLWILNGFGMLPRKARPAR